MRNGPLWRVGRWIRLGILGSLRAGGFGVEVPSRAGGLGPDGVGAGGKDAAGIEFVMGEVVVAFDVIEVHGFGDSGKFVEASGVVDKVRVFDEAS